MGGRKACRIDDGALPHVGLWIAGGERLQGLLRGVACLQQLEAKGSVADVDLRLRRHRTNAGQCPWHCGADLEIVRLHGDAELTGLLVARDDGVSHCALS